MVVGRGELTDRAWAQLAPLLPRNRQRGGRWRDHRTVIDGSCGSCLNRLARDSASWACDTRS
jgi:transposase